MAAMLLDLSQLGTASELAADRREAGVVGLFASTYIGGSVNYAALGEITGLSADSSFSLRPRRPTTSFQPCF